MKDQPKWGTVFPLETNNKTRKLNASGAYFSSSNQDINEASPGATSRPIGQKAAKSTAERQGESIITLFRRQPVK